jgi:hypothetical protein
MVEVRLREVVPDKELPTVQLAYRGEIGLAVPHERGATLYAKPCLAHYPVHDPMG